MDRWSPDRLSLSFLPATRQPMPPEMVAFHGSPSYRIAGILPALLLMDRWHPAGCLSYRIAGILPALLLMERWSPAGSSSNGSLVSRPAVFIFSSCHTRGDATRDGGVPWLSSYRIAGILPALLLMDRWHPAGCLYLFFLPHVSRCHQEWWRSMALPLIGSPASCRLFF
jgi:hypothetical protein